MAKRRRKLGRGLDALIGATPELGADADADTQELPVERIRPQSLPATGAISTNRRWMSWPNRCASTA